MNAHKLCTVPGPCGALAKSGLLEELVLRGYGSRPLLRGGGMGAVRHALHQGGHLLSARGRSPQRRG